MLGFMIAMLLVFVMMLCFCVVRVICDDGVSLLVCGLGGFVRSLSLNEMTHGPRHTH